MEKLKKKINFSEQIKFFLSKEKYFFFMSLTLVWQLLFFVFPIIAIFAFIFLKYKIINLSLSFFINKIHILVIFRSVILASITAFITLFIGYPVAYLISFNFRKYKLTLIFLLSLPFLINILIQIYAWFFVFERNGLLNKFLFYFGFVNRLKDYISSYSSIYLIMVNVYLVFMIMPLYSILEKIDYKLVEASLDLGASFRQTFFKIILPLSKNGFKAGFFLVFVTSFGEYVIPTLIGGQKKLFVGSLISEYFFVAKDWYAGCSFIILSSLFLVIFYVFYNFLFNKFLK